jgi:hypothetical protein
MTGDVPVNPAPNNGWYANIDLPEDGSARTVSFSFENGAVQATRTFNWTATNLAAIDNLTIRVGDSLRLTAFDGAIAGDTPVALYINGNLLGNTSAQVPVKHLFDTAGDYQLRAVYQSSDGQTLARTVSIEVMAAAFDGSPVGLVDQWRDWDNPQLPSQAYVDFDAAIPHLLPVAQSVGTRLTFKVPDLETRYIAARLWQGGPIIAHAVVRSEQVFSANSTETKYLDIYPDGTSVVQMKVVVDNLQPEIQVHLDIVVGGVAFQDVTGLHKVLTAADFDANGVAIVTFIQAPNTSTSTCHTMSIFQESGGAYIGKPN